ncbi:non-ribosomal peptide synthetase, partial [Pyxidicoccus trucidator]|uniref:non-ribosomal peptide synthetase n=1 Tax=Pyxidicoccus trucidator TaxID=2709662 RepID=UPI0013DC206F
AFTELVRRHESLRTTFHADAGHPFQRIHPPTPFHLSRVDLSAREDREAEARRLVLEDAARPFDLATGPLLRTALLRLSERQHLLVLNFHHIVSDGWSTDVLVREVAALYEALRQGRPSPLPALPVQYADYAVWQRDWLQGEALEQQLGWWKQQLAGAPHALELPTDFPRPPVQTSRGATLHFQLPRELSRALEALCQKQGATLFMGLLAATQALLARHSGQQDIVLGSPIAGRRFSELEGLIGFFINTLALRARLDDNPSFTTLLGRVRETTLGAFAYQDVPFEKLVEELQPQRDLSRSPLFQAMVVFQNAMDTAARDPGRGTSSAQDALAIRFVELEDTSAKFDLTFSFVSTPEGLASSLNYCVDLFREDTARRLTSHLRALLEAVTARPEQPLLEVPLLSAAERHRVLRAWNDTAAGFPVDSTFHHVFEHQAALTPDAPAVCFEEDVLSFAQLNARANQLAHHLRSLGVGPDVPVAFCLERSAEAVVALLGVMKSGGGYVPLDPAWPLQRRTLTLQDCRAPVLLTRQALVDGWHPAGARVLCLDTEAALLASRPTHDPAPVTSAANLAYVIYTSGSTGTPKGVMIQHHSVLNLRHALRQSVYAGQPAGLRVSVNAPLSFDASVKQLVQLLDGHCLFLVPDVIRQDPRALVDWVRRHRVDVLDCTPSLLRLMLQEGLLQGETAPRLLVPGGESLDEATWLELAAAPATRTFNVYGPTECTVDSTAFGVRTGTRPTIGGPLANVHTYVLDAWLRPVPVGVPGELFISGAGLARGYLHRADLTAERFLPDAFSPTPGARMYRTGDKVRWLADGTLDYLGRTDFQVKLRGFRIEPGEIESVLALHPAVHQAVVLVREDVPGDKRLVAWFSSRTQPPASSELRSFLKERLPEYMVPSVFVPLESLPLTPNGKVDRKALPAPEASLLASSSAYVAPATPTEEQLAAVWAQVLRVEKVGRHDDFFALGGHSLLATQVVARIRTALGVELPLRALFESPTLEQLALQVEKASHSTGIPALRPVPRQGSLPLSFAQQRLWFLDQLQPGGALYNIPTPLRLEGALEVAVLERAFTELVRRHESLRTTFHADAGHPFQRIHPPTPFHLSRVDLSAREDREAEVRRLVLEDAARPFDLATGPLLRTALLRLSEQQHVLLLNLHHIVSDGWSTPVLMREVATLYEAFRQGQPSPLPELPVQYADYAVWQRGWLQGEALDAQLGWWKQQLAGAPHALELPTDFPRPPVQSFRGATVHFQLPRALSRALEALCQKQGATLFMGLLAATQALLARHSGQQDIVLGSPIAGRRFSELEGLIGFFINTLALRARMEDNPSFSALLGRVRESTLGAFACQDVPFEKLVEELRPQRDLSRSPLFQAMVILQNASEASAGSPGAASSARSKEVLAIQPVEGEGSDAKFDLTFAFVSTPEGLAGSLNYCVDLFREDTVRRLAFHLQRLLEAVTAWPEQSLLDVPLLSAAERQTLLVEWNDTRTPLRRGLLHHLVSAQAARTPDALALVAGEVRLSYRQLDARANRLAHALHAQGVRPEVRVAVLLERNADLLVALLAILKAGGTYVPLDANYPRSRLTYTLADSQARLLLAHRPLLDSLQLDSQALSTLCLDSLPEGFDSRPDSPPESSVGEDNLAYVIYTSGSTGQPKGVAITHANATAFLDWATGTFSPAQLAGTLAATSICFDLSVFELFAPLTCGGAVLLARDALALPSLPAAREVTLLNTVPSAAAELLRLGAIPPSVSTVNLAGEPLPGALARGLYATGTVQHVFNLYGPTEDTTYSTFTRVPEGPGEPTIGLPLPQTSAYILNPRLQLQPVGVPGELYLAGAGLARGYLAQPALTAERFVPDAFSPTPGARMYRTGDLVRRRADGQLEYLGRTDFQVKVRGFRIELGEIEASLRQYPGVQQVLVMAREDVPGDKRLVAYVVPPAGVDADALRTHVRKSLPDFMVPSAFVPLEALPLTPNGKVDRRALPAPGASLLASSSTYVAPASPTEERLASIWAQVLRVEKVGRHDDFFALGGHSLLATQLVSRVRSTLDVELPLRALFEAPTVEGLAARIESARHAAPLSRAPAIVPVPRSGPLPLSFAQQRLWFIDQLSPGLAAYNMPAVEWLNGFVDPEALRRSLEELVQRHEALRTTFVQHEGQPVQRIAPRAELPLRLVDLSGLAPAAAQAALQLQVGEEAQGSFNLATGPLVRATLWKLGSDSHVLLLNMHHIVSDGWSMGVLVREVMALYEAFSQGRPSPLPPLALQYADYAVWQRDWMQGAVLEEQLAWWRQKLAGLTPLELPIDKPRPPVQTFRGDQVHVGLSPDVSNTLKALCQQEGATPFMALLAAFQLLLARYSGQRDISVGSPIAGRQYGELEGLIGFFVNTLVMRARVEAPDSFRTLLRQVKESALGAYAHQDVPFERLVEEIQPTRDLGRTPLFQVLFVLQNTPTPSPTKQQREPATGAAPPQVERQSPAAKFELHLGLEDSPEGYQGTLGYNTDLFESDTIQRMAEHFRTLVAAVVSRPDAPLGSLSMLPQAERQRLLVDWNATASEYPRTSTLPEVFAQVVARHADKVAVEFASELQGELGASKLTYRQLDERANQLAHHLRGLGVSTDSRVAIALDRSLELIVSLVAILKAGGAYVPLDPSYPRERLAAMLEDARPTVLITTRELLEKLPTEGLSTVVLGEVSVEGQPTSALPVAALPQSLAYIDFTSGSTGRPKGVGTPHAAVLRTLFGVDYAHLGPDETFLLIAPLSFDASTLELWGPLLHGARLVVFPPHSPSDLKSLEDVLTKHGVTTLHLTAGLFTQVVDHNLPALRGVKQLLTGGDVVSAPHVRRVLEGMLIPVTACYGPTESTLFASCHRMTSVEHVGASVSIGRPIGNTQMYVLDGSGQPVPVGVTGELFIGGDGVSRGYLEQPALTAEHFMPDAFSSTPGARLYRTGDLARWRRDGLLDFLGRADAQVKVRGYRIELAEVEAALLAFPGVGQTVAVVREDVPGDKRLVAYVAASETLDVAGLRAFIKERLPEYMVPSAVVRLDALPLTANSKVDRKALPAPDVTRASLAESYVA